MPLAATVNEIMTKHVRTINIETSALDALALMIDAAVRHLPVVDKNGDLVGIVSHRDLMMHDVFTTSSPSFSEAESPLKERMVNVFMSASPETVSPDTEIAEAADLLLENKFGCLPVVEGIQLVGILTEADFVKHVRTLATERPTAKPATVPRGKNNTDARGKPTVPADEIY